MSSEMEKVKKVMSVAGTAGASTVLKALGSLVPHIGHFSSGALAAGYAADQVLNFLKDKLETPSGRRNREQLQSRAEQGVARPDEQASLSQIEQAQSPANTLMGLGRIGAQAAGGSSALGQAQEQEAQSQSNQQQQMQLQQAGLQQRQQAEQQRQDEYAQNVQQKQRQMVQQRNESQQKQAQQDQLATVRRQQDDIRRKEDLGFKQRAEERAIEKHKSSMGKPIVKGASTKKVPADYAEALAQLDALLNGLQ